MIWRSAKGNCRCLEIMVALNLETSGILRSGKVDLLGFIYSIYMKHVVFCLGRIILLRIPYFTNNDISCKLTKMCTHDFIMFIA